MQIYIKKFQKRSPFSTLIMIIFFIVTDVHIQKYICEQKKFISFKKTKKPKVNYS